MKSTIIRFTTSIYKHLAQFFCVFFIGFRRIFQWYLQLHRKGVVLIVLLSIILLVSLGMDLFNRKIKNWWVLISLIFALLYVFKNYDMRQILDSFFGTVFGFAILFFLYVCKAIGAGDVKLFSVVGMMLTSQMYYRFIVVSFLIAFVLGSFLLVVKLIKRQPISLHNPTTIHFTIPMIFSFLCLIGGIY